MKAKLFAIFIIMFSMTGFVLAEEVTLFAGQTMNAGTVEVTNDADNIYVEYVADNGWEVLGTHLYVGKTNPDELTTAPGQFPYSGGVSYELPLISIDDYVMQLNKKGKSTGKMIALDETGIVPGDSVYVAAHAEVRFLESTDYIELISNGDFELPLLTSSWGNYPDVNLSGWTTTARDNPLTSPGLEFQRNLFLTAADGSQYVELAGAVPIVLTQTVDACESGEYLLSYAYAKRQNHESKMSVSFGDYVGEHTASVMKWELVSVDVNGPTEGTFDLVFTETGSADSYGMLLDAVSVQCKVYNYIYESAWADGTDFTQKNWAMYFEYEGEPVLIETVEVLSDGSTSSSVFSPTDGGDYTLEASGTYKFANWAPYGIADAEWSYRKAQYTPNNVAGWIAGEGYFGSECGLDVQVDETCVDWGALNEAGHIYNLSYVGTGNPVTFDIHDSAYGDNLGSITVDIYGKLW